MARMVSTRPGTSLTYSRGMSGSALYARIPQMRTPNAHTGTRYLQSPTSNAK